MLIHTYWTGITETHTSLNITHTSLPKTTAAADKNDAEQYFCGAGEGFIDASLSQTLLEN